MKNAHERSEQNSRENGDRSGGSPEQGDGSGTPKGYIGGGGGDQLPPGLMEALGEALNDEEFKRTLEQIGKQMGKDMQVWGGYGDRTGHSRRFSGVSPGRFDRRARHGWSHLSGELLVRLCTGNRVAGWLVLGRPRG